MSSSLTCNDCKMARVCCPRRGAAARACQRGLQRRGMVLGVGLTQVRTLVVKSRGHFRAAFDDFAPPERILEVDCLGLTTPNLKSLPWRYMPRPIYPIDDHTTWSP